MTAPTEPYRTTKAHIAAHLIARGEALLSFSDGVFVFPASAGETANRLERPATRRTKGEDRRYFEKAAGGRLVRR